MVDPLHVPTPSRKVRPPTTHVSGTPVRLPWTHETLLQLHGPRPARVPTPLPRPSYPWPFPFTSETSPTFYWCVRHDQEGDTRLRTKEGNLVSTRLKYWLPSLLQDLERPGPGFFGTRRTSGDSAEHSGGRGPLRGYDLSGTHPRDRLRVDSGREVGTGSPTAGVWGSTRVGYGSRSFGIFRLFSGSVWDRCRDWTV